MVPVVGSATTGAKYVNKGLKYGEEIVDAGKTIKKDIPVDAKPKVDADIPKSEVTQKSPTNANNQLNQDSADALITSTVTKKSSKGAGEASKIANELDSISKYDDFYSYEYNSFNNPGPLADFRGQPNKNFYGGRYNIEVLNEPKIFYRAGDINSPLGQWFTETLPSSVAKVRIDTAVKEQWIDKNGVLSGKSPLNTVFKIEGISISKRQWLSL